MAAGQHRLPGSLPVNQVLQLSGSHVEFGKLHGSLLPVAKLVPASNLEDSGNGELPLLFVIIADHSLDQGLAVRVPGRPP